jgi:hypothetical protein
MLVVAACRVSDAFAVTKFDRLTAIRPDCRDAGNFSYSPVLERSGCTGTELDGLLSLNFNIGGHPPAE